MKYLGVDYGLTYIGLSLGDDESCISTPFDTIREKDLIKQLTQIKQLVQDEGVDSIVVGYPLTLEGLEKEQASKTLDFITKLSSYVSVPVHREDERLSSKMGKKLAIEAHKSGHDEHALAATAILQSYIDRIQNS